MKHDNDYHVKVNVKYKKPYNSKDTLPIDIAISKFNKKIKDVGLMPEIQGRSFFISKSEKRRKQKNAGKFRQIKTAKTKNNTSILFS